MAEKLKSELARRLWIVMDCVDLENTLENDYLVAKIGFDTEENEPLQGYTYIHAILIRRSDLRSQLSS